MDLRDHSFKLFIPSLPMIKGHNCKGLKAVKKSCSVCLLFGMLLSCANRPYLDYDKNARGFDEVANCLVINYTAIFKTVELRIPVVSLNSEDLIRKHICEAASQLFERENIDYIEFERDSTIVFCSKLHGFIKTKQSILFYIKDSSKIKEKITNVFEPVKAFNAHWMLFERIISAAD